MTKKKIKPQEVIKPPETRAQKHRRLRYKKTTMIHNGVGFVRLEKRIILKLYGFDDD